MNKSLAAFLIGLSLGIGITLLLIWVGIHWFGLTPCEMDKLWC